MPVPLPDSHDELLALARRLCWWKRPEDALTAPLRFLAQVMALGTWDDIRMARRYWTDDEFRAVLREPPAGLFDPRSWNYWHCVLGVGPVPPMPVRILPFPGQRQR